MVNLEELLKTTPWGRDYLDEDEEMNLTQTYDFPFVYNEQVDQQTERDIDTEKQYLKNELQQLMDSKGKQPEFGNYLAVGVVLGILVGFMGCIGVCRATEQNSAANGLKAGLIILGVSLVLSGILFVIMSKKYEENSSEIRRQTNLERKESLKKESKIKAAGEKKKKEYLEQFEEAAQQASVYFPNNDLMQYITNWISEGFFRAINYADRRKHVPQISVPFAFEVYRSKIVCNAGTVDFETKRIAELKNPVEQTALARAIISDLHLKTVMKYPNDISGTSIQIRIEYQYFNDHVRSVIIYEATNGFYTNVTALYDRKE